MAAAPRHVERCGGLTVGKRGVGGPGRSAARFMRSAGRSSGGLARDRLRQVALADRVLDEDHVTGTLLSKVGWAEAKRCPLLRVVVTSNCNRHSNRWCCEMAAWYNRPDERPGVPRR
jgi:hypothetical protein